MRYPWLGEFTAVHSLAFSLANSETQFCQRIENIFVFLGRIPMNQSQVEWCEKQRLSYWFTMRSITVIMLSTFASIWPVQSSTKQHFMEVKLQSEFVGWARKRARLVSELYSFVFSSTRHNLWCLHETISTIEISLPLGLETWDLVSGHLFTVNGGG